jgi:hypothetical protein
MLRARRGALSRASVPPGHRIHGRRPRPRTFGLDYGARNVEPVEQM